MCNMEAKIHFHVYYGGQNFGIKGKAQRYLFIFIRDYHWEHIKDVRFNFCHYQSTEVIMYILVKSTSSDIGQVEVSAFSV